MHRSQINPQAIKTFSSTLAVITTRSNDRTVLELIKTKRWLMHLKLYGLTRWKLSNRKRNWDDNAIPTTRYDQNKKKVTDKHVSEINKWLMDQWQATAVKAQTTQKTLNEISHLWPGAENRIKSGRILCRFRAVRRFFNSAGAKRLKLSLLSPYSPMLRKWFFVKKYINVPWRRGGVRNDTAGQDKTDAF